MQIIIRSGDTKRLLEDIQEKGFFEFSRWGSKVRLEYREGDDYPMKLIIDGVLQQNIRQQELLTFLYDNRKNINTQIRIIQGKPEYPNTKYLHVERSLFEGLLKTVYKNHLRAPTLRNTGYYSGLENLARKIMPVRSFERLKTEAFEELQAETKKEKEKNP
jgi:hypothetical protein